MPKCIFCGSELTINIDYPKILGYKCINCNLEWPLAEHKDNQNWAVRHIRALEKEKELMQSTIKDLQEALLLLQQKVTG